MKKETKKAPKKEKVTLEKLAKLIEKLAIFTVNGFERMEAQMMEFRKQAEGIKEEVSSVKEEQKDNTRRLVSIERKLTGTQISLDETVHRHEFKKLEHRVEALES